MTMKDLQGAFVGGLAWALITSCVGHPGASVNAPARDALPREDADAPRCRLPSDPAVLHREGAAVLLSWELPHTAVLDASLLPGDTAYLAYRSAFSGPGVEVRTPPLLIPSDSEVPDEVWEAERSNNERVYSGRVGKIEGITCLDALLFAYQNARVPQLEDPTEFLVSVLRRVEEGRPRLAVIFGASDEMFPPRSVYGLDVVDGYLDRGWDYWYMLHNHTVQREGDRTLPGVPVPSTSDVQMSRSLVETRGLQSVRVTNGFYTSIVSAAELDELTSR